MSVLLLFSAFFSLHSQNVQDFIKGTVVDEIGPVSGVIVRIQSTDVWTTTDELGRFQIRCSQSGSDIRLTAWAPGYYIAGGTPIDPGAGDVVLTLIAHSSEDNRDYLWELSFHRTEDGQVKGCAECHSRQGTDFPYDLPFDEWQRDAHSQTALNPRFLSVYSGTDVKGNRSPVTRFVKTPDYGMIPMRPDPSQPYFGPGYKLDFPGTAGNCAACHLPVAAIDNPYAIDPTSVEGAAKEGVSCDFCHKTWDVNLDPQTGLPGADMPGVLSFEFRRPEKGHQFFSGPLDDVAPGEDTYVPFQSESRFCAPCHFGKFWDTIVYNSYGEWLNSPYSKPETGQTCQDCHMPRTGTSYIARPDKGGIERDAANIFSHRMPGAADKDLLENSVSMRLTAERNEGKISLVVRITNDRTGHHVPTGSPLRHLILLVRVTDDEGQTLKLSQGSVLPDWIGQGDPKEGYYASLPGKAFAKVLANVWTGVYPSTEYWQQTRIVSDNRIPAFATDVSKYIFHSSEGTGANIEVMLLYRRAYKELMDQKKWIVPDIIIACEEMRIASLSY